LEEVGEVREVREVVAVQATASVTTNLPQPPLTFPNLAPALI
jgi:hypothetical protein